MSKQVINNPGSQTKEILRILQGIVILSLSIYFIYHTLHFFRFTKEDLGKYFDIRWILILHISGGAIALLIGPFQLWEKFRTKRWRLHRVLGFIYLLAILVSSTCAIYLSVTTAFQVNNPYAFSLHIWIGVWVVSTFIAYYAAIKRKFLLHQEWMTRSYIATVAFVLSALILRLPQVQRYGNFAEISPSIFWFGWAVPFFVYDIILSARRKK